MKKSLVSIIVPIYNTSGSLDRCIRSLVDQTYSKLEIILIDDGSSDTSLTMCNEWAGKDSRIRVVHKPNGGLSDARNVGLDICSGEYIAFVDSDDYVDKCFIERLLSSLLSKNADMSECGVVWESESGVVDSTIRWPFVRETVLTGMQCLNLPCETPNAVTVWNKLYRRFIWENLRFPKGRIHEDEFVFHKILFSCHVVVFLSDKLYHYVQHTNSIMHSQYTVRRLDYIDAWLDRLRMFIEYDVTIENINSLIRMMLGGMLSTAQLNWHERHNADAVVSRVNILYEILFPLRQCLDHDMWNLVAQMHAFPHVVIYINYWKHRIVNKLKRMIRLHAQM